jgi:hypothetical protein
MLKKMTTLAVFAVAIGAAAANTYANSSDRPFVETNTAALLTEAGKHRAEAAVLRAEPNASETKRPGSPGTALHCERIAARLEAAAGILPAYTGPAVATPAPELLTEAARHRAVAAVLRGAPNASETKRPGSPGTALHCERIAARLEAGPSAARATPATFAQKVPVNLGDIFSSKKVRELIANAKTPAEHMKLAKHFAAVAARYDAEAFDHVAEAKAYRSTPNASETKRPGSPDTAAHCDRLADAERKAANEARALAHDHERLAK